MSEKQYVAVKVFVPSKRGRKKGKVRINKAFGPTSADAADAMYYRFMDEERDHDGSTFIGVCELVEPE